MNLPALGWEIFYSDGTVCNSKEDLWSEVPQNGVLVVLIWHDYHVPGCRQKDIMAGHDYYWYEGENEWGQTNDYMVASNYTFKRGVWATNDEFEQVYRTAFEKLDF